MKKLFAIAIAAFLCFSANAQKLVLQPLADSPSAYNLAPDSRNVQLCKQLADAQIDLAVAYIRMGRSRTEYLRDTRYNRQALDIWLALEQGTRQERLERRYARECDLNYRINK